MINFIKETIMKIAGKERLVAVPRSNFGKMDKYIGEQYDYQELTKLCNSGVIYKVVYAAGWHPDPPFDYVVSFCNEVFGVVKPHKYKGSYEQDGDLAGPLGGDWRNATFARTNKKLTFEIKEVESMKDVDLEQGVGIVNARVHDIGSM